MLKTSNTYQQMSKKIQTIRGMNDLLPKNFVLYIDFFS
ncbi:MAG: Histidyl-tRNA synthetase [Candidatus Ruthia sp. Apha_13_S6]|nr:Histidyl-tRNA synthetase [Candidatus Ruthia sp. Apha_13_S6]